MSALVEKLCQGRHDVEVKLRPERNGKAFKDAVDREFVHIRFVRTQGGTELGLKLDKELCRFEGADFVTGAGEAHIVGTTGLDYVKVRCVADIDLSTFAGVGHLERV